MQKELIDVFTSVHEGSLDVEAALQQLKMHQTGQTAKKETSIVAQEQPAITAKSQSIPSAQPTPDLAAKIQDYLRAKLTKAIGDLPIAVDLDRNLMDLGLDSIQLTTLTSEIEIEVAIELYPTVFFEYPNLHELTLFFAQEHPHAFQKLLYKTPVTDDGLVGQSLETAVLSPKPESINPFRASSQPTEIAQPHKPVQPSLDNDDIAIIGMHGLFAESPTLDRFWQNLLQRKDLITEIPVDRFDYKKWYNPDPEAEDSIYCKWGSFIEDVDKFDAAFFGVSPHEADWMDPQLRLLLQSIYAASEDAGYATKMRSTNTGIFVGSCFQDYRDRVREFDYPMDPYLGTGNSYSVLANRASFVFDFTGPSMPFDTACSSSLFALHAATTAMQNGECDSAFVSGLNLILYPFRHRYFCNIGALSKTGRCHTFAAAADGYVPGEAITTVLLKPLRQAEKDGDQIHAIIKGSAALHGGYTPSLTAPSVQGETNVILKAWENANIDPASLTYIEAHGTGTPLGDPIEINAIKKAFAQHTDKVDFCALGSSKAHIGHTEGAAGLASIIKVVLQMKHGQIPAMPQFEKQNPYIKLDDSPLYINREPIEWKRDELPRRAGINSFGFSGSYAHVVLEEYIPQESDQNNPVHLQEQGQVVVPLSARDERGVRQMAENLLTHLLEHDTLQVQDIAYTLQMGREPMTHRTAFIVQDLFELQEKLRAFNAGLENGSHAISGQVRKEDRLLLATDDDLNALAQAWIAHGKMNKIAALWVRGWDVDWQLLYPKHQPQLKSLPTYPFAKERYWVTEKYSGKTSPSKPQDEPPILDVAQINIKEQILTQEEATPTATLATHQRIVEPVMAETVTLQHVIDDLAKSIEAMTGIAQTQLDIDEEVQNYGFDSIVITKLAGDLEQIIGKKDTSIFFSANTIHTISENIFNKYRDAFATAVSIPKHPPTATASAAQTPEMIPVLLPSNATVEKETRPVKNNDVAIVGIAGKYPQADNLAEFFEILKQGVDAIEEIPKARWDYGPHLGKAHENGKMRAKWGGFISQANEFDYENFNMSFREALVTHPEERLLLQQTWHCLESAGYNPLTWVKEKGSHTGVYIGASFHDYPYLVAEGNQQNEDYIPFSSQTFSYANRLSYFYNLTGPSVTLDTACSSSLYAVFAAYNDIISGACDSALAGGVNLNLHPSKFILLSELNFLSLDGRCHSFADGGDGYVPGEGIGMVMLKRMDLAERDNDNILAVIRGVSAGNDGRTNGFTVPNPDAQSDIINRALQNAGIDAETITAVECHGTGTVLGDPIEISALTDTFRNYTEKSQYCAVSSVKANIGHLEAAAGIAQITKAILQLKNKLLFPNVMHSPQLNQNILFSDTPFFVQQDLGAWNNIRSDIPRRIGVSSFGAGGTNVHLILEEYQPTSNLQDGLAESKIHIIPFSADSETQLLQIIEDTYHFLTDAKLNVFASSLTVANIAGTLQHGRAAKKHRLGLKIK